MEVATIEEAFGASVAQKFAALVRYPLRRKYAIGEGMVVVGPPWSGEASYPLDYYVLLGKVAMGVVFKYLTKIKIGGILVVEVNHLFLGEVNEVKDLINKEFNHHAFSYFVDGINYLFITRLEE